MILGSFSKEKLVNGVLSINNKNYSCRVLSNGVSENLKRVKREATFLKINCLIS